MGFSLLMSQASCLQLVLLNCLLPSNRHPLWLHMVQLWKESCFSEETFLQCTGVNYEAIISFSHWFKTLNGGLLLLDPLFWGTVAVKFTITDLCWKLSISNHPVFSLVPWPHVNLIGRINRWAVYSSYWVGHPTREIHDQTTSEQFLNLVEAFVVLLLLPHRTVLCSKHSCTSVVSACLLKSYAMPLMLLMYSNSGWTSINCPVDEIRTR